MSKILRALNDASSRSPWVVTPIKHSLETEFQEEPSTRNFFIDFFLNKILKVVNIRSFLQEKKSYIGFHRDFSMEKTNRRSFYQKLLIALCSVIILIHVKTMMMIRETQEQAFLVLSQLTSQKEQLAQLNTSSQAAHGQFHGALQDIYAQMGSIEKGTQVLYQKNSGMENEIFKLNAAIKTVDSRNEKMYKEVLEKLQQAAATTPAQP